MTESNSPTTDSHDKAAALLSKGNDARSNASPQSNHFGPTQKTQSGGALKTAFIVVLLLAVGLGAMVWFLYQSGQQFQSTVRAQLDQTSQAVTDVNQLTRQLQGQVVLQGATLTQLQASVKELQAQVGNLDQAFQVLTDSGSDLVLLNDIDHLVSIASQQITLGGNVANAIVALETAQARLSRANRPALAAIQQTLNGDLERLRAVAVVDVPALSAQLEQLNGLLGQAPLLVPDDAAPGVVKASGTDSAGAPMTPYQSDPGVSWGENLLGGLVHWSGQLWSVVRHDLAGLISVRRVDDGAALLISPDQADQLRLTLRLRVMTAQLALMMRQSDVWKAELEAISGVLRSHFDGQSPETQRAVRMASRLLDTPVDTRLPALTQTRSALEAVRQESSRSLEQRRGSSSLATEPAPAASAAPEQTSADTPPEPPPETPAVSQPADVPPVSAVVPMRAQG